MEEAQPHKKHFSLSLLFLWLSVLIFSAANSVVAKLGILGAHHLTDGRNPISFCNVLFTANIIAGITLYAIHRKTWNRKNLQALSAFDWVNMFILAILAGVIGPTLFFIGLMLTQVINVVLVSTLDIPLTLLLAWAMLKERPSVGTIIASLFALSGIVITFYLHQPQMSQPMKMTMINIGEGPVAHFLSTIPKAGELCIALATFFTVFSVEFSRKYLSRIPVGIFSVFRMVAGSVIFFFIVLVMLGWIHFIDIFNPFLIEWMLFYGGVIIALGLYLWYKSIKETSSGDLAITNAFQPIAGIFFAFLILKEIPERGQIIGGGIIFIGIAIALFEKLIKERLRKQKIIFQKPRSFTGV